jgi:cytochrome P450
MTLCQKYLPEGTIVGMNAWVLHRDKQVFGDDVETFRPERWLDASEEQQRLMNRSFFPVRSYVPCYPVCDLAQLANLNFRIQFGYGSRICLGKISA